MCEKGDEITRFDGTQIQPQYIDTILSKVLFLSAYIHMRSYRNALVESSEPEFVNFSGAQESIPGLLKRLEIRAQVKRSD